MFSRNINAPVFRDSRTAYYDSEGGSRGENVTIPEVYKGDIFDILDLEGLRVLGCVTEVTYNCVKMSLPGCNVGIMPHYLLEDFFFKNCDSTSSDTSYEPLIHSVFKPGMTLPCKIVQISNLSVPRILDLKYPKEFIVSVQPRHIEIDNNQFYPKMVLSGACYASDEGHRFMDTGDESEVAERIRETGQSYVLKKICQAVVVRNTSGIYPNYPNMFEIENFEYVPEVITYQINPEALLPGARIQVRIVKVDPPYIYMDYQGCFACTFLPFGSESQLRVGYLVVGTVLFVHPRSHLIYLMLGDKPTPNTFENYFRYKIKEFIPELHFQQCFKDRAFFKFSADFAFIRDIHTLRDREKGRINFSEFTQQELAILLQKNFYVYQLHYMDKVIELTQLESLVKENYIPISKIKIGKIFEGVIEKYLDNEMIVSVSSAFEARVEKIFLPYEEIKRENMDRYLNYTTALRRNHPEGERFHFRVVDFLPAFKLAYLTCKPELLNIKRKYLPKTYDEIQPGNYYRGVVSSVFPQRVQVTFLCGVMGYLYPPYIPRRHSNPPQRPLDVGEVVDCKVLTCPSDPENPHFKHVSLSIKGSQDAVCNLSSDSESENENEDSEDADSLDEYAREIQRRREEEWRRMESDTSQRMESDTSQSTECIEEIPYDPMRNICLPGIITEVTEETITIKYARSMSNEEEFFLHPNRSTIGCTSDCRICRDRRMYVTENFKVNSHARFYLDKDL